MPESFDSEANEKEIKRQRDVVADAPILRGSITKFQDAYAALDIEDRLAETYFFRH